MTAWNSPIRSVACVQSEDPGYRCDLVIPVLLHPERLRRRGYNHALELARLIIKDLECLLEKHSLQRNRSSVAQQGLGLAERNTNLRGRSIVSGSTKD